MRYIIDSRYFDGACFTSMSDDRHSDYGGETLEELREREKNPHLVAVSPGRISLLAKRYTLALSRPFQEITEERYYELFECLPPARMGSGWFFVGEDDRFHRELRSFQGILYNLDPVLSGIRLFVMEGLRLRLR